MRLVINMEAVFWAAVLSVFGGAFSAPANQMSGCMAITSKDSESMNTCCNFPAPFTNETLAKCEKERDPKGTKQYECLEDCWFSSDAVVGANKKLDAPAWKKLVAKTLDEEWKDIAANSVDKCEGFTATVGGSMEKSCPTTQNDLQFKCMIIQWYLKCPKSSWQSSDTCNESRKKFETCLGSMFSK